MSLRAERGILTINIVFKVRRTMAGAKKIYKVKDLDVDLQDKCR